jgi:hypothetical protein
VLEFDDVRGAGDESDHAVDTVGDAEGVGGDDDNDDDSAGDDDGDDDVPLANRKKNNSKRYKFEKRRSFVPPQLPPFIPELETPAPDDRFPIEYVNMFLTDDMIENLVLESNKYATEKTGSCPNSTNDYWRSDLRYGQIADKMSRNRFRLIHRTLHFVDNNMTSDEDKLDHVWKLWPWIQKLQANFSIVSCDEFQSVDEIIVTFKGRSILRMYLPKKPKKWGIKLWGRASPNGILHAFDVYQGKGTGLRGD